MAFRLVKPDQNLGWSKEKGRLWSVLLGVELERERRRRRRKWRRREKSRRR